MNGRHAYISLKTESETQNRLFFFDVQIVLKDKTFNTTVYCKPSLKTELIHILTAVSHLPKSLVLYAHSLIDASEYTQRELNFPLNYFFRNKFYK